MTAAADAVSRTLEFVDAHLDTKFLIDTLAELAKVPTDVPLGFDTLIEPDDPKLVHYVQEVLRPRLLDAGGTDIVDAARNNLVVRLGRGGSRSVLLQSYTPAQHHNLMPDPWSGRVGPGAEVGVGVGGDVVHGQGVSAAKAHQAVMLAVIKLLHDANVDLDGTVWWAVNNEGRSSHASTHAILDAIDGRPEWAILLVASGMAITVANRGRVDIDVVIEGRAAHSSTPHLGANTIEGAAEVVRRLRQISWPDTHPVLGGRHVVVYKVRYSPLAPHTLPSRAELTVDRRLLPGDTVDDAVEEVRQAIGDLAPFEVTVSPSVVMLPALVARDAPVVRSLQRSYRTVRGADADEIVLAGSFDAGGGIARGVPTIMWGAGGGGDWPLGPDWVPIDDVVDEARVLAHLLQEHFA